MAKLSIDMLSMNTGNTLSKPSLVRMERLFEKMETEWKKYEKIFDSLEDEDEFIEEQVVYSKLAVEFYDAEHGVKEFLRAMAAIASTSSETVSTSTASDFGSSPEMASVPLAVVLSTVSPSGVEIRMTKPVDGEANKPSIIAANLMESMDENAPQTKATVPENFPNPVLPTVPEPVARGKHVKAEDGDLPV